MKMPKTIYVKTESDTDGSEYLVADTAPDSLVETGERKKIGVYRLVEIKTASAQVKLT